MSELVSHISYSFEETRQFWPDPELWDGFNVSELMEEVQGFALRTFDRLDLNGDGFISAAELDHVLNTGQLHWRDQNYVQFLHINVDKIGRAFDDNDGISPCGISRNDLIQGISRNDLVEYFSKL